MTPLAFKSAFFLSLLGASITHGTNLNCDISRGHLALKVSRPVLLSFGMSPGLTHQLLMSVGSSQAYCPGRIIPEEIQLRLTNSRDRFPHLFKLHPVAVHRQRKRTKTTTRMRHCSDFVASTEAPRARLQPNKRVRGVRKGKRAERERVPAGGLGNLLWYHGNRYTDGVDDVLLEGRSQGKKQLERRGLGLEEDESNRNERAKQMKLVRHQLGMPPSISFSSDFELLIESDSDGIVYCLSRDDCQAWVRKTCPQSV